MNKLSLSQVSGPGIGRAPVIGAVIASALPGRVFPPFEPENLRVSECERFITVLINDLPFFELECTAGLISRMDATPVNTATPWTTPDKSVVVGQHIVIQEMVDCMKRIYNSKCAALSAGRYQFGEIDVITGTYPSQ